jgi:hypothetical protein
VVGDEGGLVQNVICLAQRTALRFADPRDEVISDRDNGGRTVVTCRQSVIGRDDFCPSCGDEDQEKDISQKDGKGILGERVTYKALPRYYVFQSV